MAGKNKGKKKADNVAATNRKARHNYFIEDTLEAGIQLYGSEVKSLRQGHATIGDAYAVEKNGELYLSSAYIPEYSGASHFSHEPKRQRKLLLHRREIDKLAAAIARDGMTIVPLKLYFNDRGIAKVELGLAKGKHKADKRQTTKDRDWKRDKARMMSHKQG